MGTAAPPCPEPPDFQKALSGTLDVELMSRMAERGPARSIPRVLALYRIHSNSISSIRYLRQQRVFEFVAARNQARLNGNDLSYEEFVSGLEQQPPLRRMMRKVKDQGRAHYQNTVVHMAERRFVRAACSASLAMICNPRHLLHRAGTRFGLLRGRSQ